MTGLIAVVIHVVSAFHVVTLFGHLGQNHRSWHLFGTLNPIQQSLLDARVLDGNSILLNLLVVFFAPVVFVEDASGERQLENVVFRDNFKSFLDVNIGVRVIFIDTDANADLLNHAGSDDAVFMLSDDDTLVLHRLDSDAVALGVLVLDGDDDLREMPCADSSELDNCREDLKRAFHVIVKDTGDHGVGLVDKLTEGLFFVDSTQNHLMLALLSHILNRRCLHVETRSHGASLHPAVSDALSGDEFLIEVGVGLRFLQSFNLLFLLSQSAVNIEVFSFDDVVFLGFQEFLLLILVDVKLFLHVKGRHGCRVNLGFHGCRVDFLLIRLLHRFLLVLDSRLLLLTGEVGTLFEVIRF